MSLRPISIFILNVITNYSFVIHEYCIGIDYRKYYLPFKLNGSKFVNKY